jgi:hypothetical protein
LSEKKTIPNALDTHGRTIGPLEVYVVLMIAAGANASGDASKSQEDHHKKSLRLHRTLSANWCGMVSQTWPKHSQMYEVLQPGLGFA